MGFFGVSGRRRPRAGALVLGGLFGLVVACASGPRFDGASYKDDDVAFRVGPLPADVRRVDASDARLAFRDDRVGATWAVSARCGLDGDDVPLQALLHHLFLQFTDRRQIREESFTLDGRAALEVELEATIDGVPRRFLVAVLKKDGCVYDFVHVDPGGKSPGVQESRDAFRAFVRGFRTE